MWKLSQDEIATNTLRSQVECHVKPTGFREYDARWVFPRDINKLGLQRLGAGLGTQLRERGDESPGIIVGHDYRSYSQTVKQALIIGLMSAGCEVHDVGLALTPMAAFARNELGIPAMAMVTASHNENGWTGVKMGIEPPLTHGPEEMARLKEIVLGEEFAEGAGRYVAHEDIRERYIASIASSIELTRSLTVVVGTGNGTAGAFAPALLRRLGCTVIEQDCELDWTFPRYNPNPEDIAFLESLRAAVLESDADAGLAFDGDGDRVGVVDDTGEMIFSDKVGLLIARSLAPKHPGSHFVVDVKSTGLFAEDVVLRENDATVEYWITGHSYMKRRIHETQALAGFEKSGHFFFNEPIGHGYDDALLSAALVCDLIASGKKPLSALREELPTTWQSPTMAPKCPDEEKYDVVDAMRAEFEALQQEGATIAGQPIADLITVNGVRVVLEDGTWGLVRASSNKPSLVVVCESPVSDERMRAMFTEIDRRLQKHDVGDYDQRLD